MEFEACSNKMYPKVRVREQEEEENELEYDEELSTPNDNRALLFSEVTESPPVQGKDNRSDSPLSNAKISKPYVPKLTRQLVSASKAKPKKDNEPVAENSKLYARANAVPRPRAVLSSPDNDGMIGKRNKLRNERSSSLNKCNSGQNMPDRTKGGASEAKALQMRKGLNEASRNTSSAKRKGPQGPVIPSSRKPFGSRDA